MRIRVIFLLFFISWCGTSSSQPTDIIIFDTNVCSEPLSLFDHLKKQFHIKHPTEDEPTYADLWLKFDGPNSVDTVLHEYLTDADRIAFKRGIQITKHILDLKENRPQVQIDIPKFVYNEVANGMTSKITKGTGKPSGDYVEFFKSMPIKTTVETGDLIEERDYPKKKPSASASELLTIMKDFLSKSIESNEDFKELSTHLDEDVPVKKRKTQNALDDLYKVSEGVEYKVKFWDKKLKSFLNKNGIKMYETSTELLASITGKIKEHWKNKVAKIKFDDPIDLIAKRLLKNNEEFDFFDLKIYLYAKERNAHILTFNTQAFQEVNDPIFLNFFEETKILNPNINFKASTDLDRLSDCKSVMESSVVNDFENDRKTLIALDPIKVSPNEQLDSTKWHEVFEKIFDEFKVKQASGKDLKSILEETPLFDALGLLKVVDNHVKIDPQLTFTGVNTQEIRQKLNSLKLLDQYIYNSALDADSFLKQTPTNEKVPEMLKEKTLADSLRQGLSVENHNLNEFLKIFRNEIVHGETGKISNDAVKYAKILYIESNFKRESVAAKLTSYELDPRSNPLVTCPGGRRKREINKCALTWENIDEINEEHEFRRDPKKVQINSDKFLEYIKTVDDPVVRQQLYQFADQLINPANGFDGKIVGDSVTELNRLINRNKIVDHFSKVGQVSEALNTGFFAKNILADLMNGDIKDVAVNVGFLATDQILFKIAKISELKGAAFATSGKFVLGNSFKAASPFIKRLGSALVIYDLVEQTKALESGDKDAIIRIVGDGIILGADAVEIGLGILEVVGVIASTGPLAPIVATIGAVVFIGTEVYFAVKHVEDLDKVLHLTLEEKISEGLNSIFQSPSEYLEELKEIKSANNLLAKQGLEFLQKQENIKRFIFASARLNYQTNRIELSDNIRIAPDQRSNIRWDRSGPDTPSGGSIFCSPQGDDESQIAPSGTTHKCIDAIGVADLKSKPHENVLFNLSNAYSIIEGFPDLTNIFLAGNGFKNMTGGNKDDLFSLRGDDEKSLAVIDGMSGEDTLDISDIKMNGPIEIDFERGRIEAPFDVVFKNVNKFLGRKRLKEVMMPDCETRYINGQGGLQLRSDNIVIGSRKHCHYNLTMQLSTYTVVRNSAFRGDFTYIINNGEDKISILAETAKELKHLERFMNTTHTFVIGYSLIDLKAVEIVDSIKDNHFEVMLSFFDQTLNKQIPIFFSLNTKNVRIALKDSAEIKVHNYGLYAMHKTNKSANEICEMFPSMASQFKMTMLIQSDSDNMTIIAAGDDKHNIFNNDPERNSIIFANGGNANNVFSISGHDRTIPRNVTIYSKNQPNTINTIDLRPLAQQVKKEFKRDLLILHNIDAGSKIMEIDLIEMDSNDVLMTIIIANFTDVCEHLHIILNNAPVILKCDENHHNINREEILMNYIASDHYTPVPLTFNKTEIIVITQRDIEANTDIFIEQDIGDFTFVRFDDSLIVTNTVPIANSTTYIEHSCSVLLKEFYTNIEFFETISLKFNDKIIRIADEQDALENVTIFEDWFNDFHQT